MKRLFSGLVGLVLVAGIFTACNPPSTTQPIRAAVVYPWYCLNLGQPSCAWNQQGLNPFTKYTPSQNFYSSSDTATIKGQIAAMQYGNLDAGFVSWWGQGSQEDGVMPNLLAAANGTGFKWSIYYEPEGQGDPSVTQIESDLAYIKSNYSQNRNYLWVNNKPTIYVYADANDGCGMATRWAQANASSSGGFYVTLKVFSGYAACANQPDNWHQYGPASAEDHQAGHSFTISPGFNKANEAAPRLARNLTTWQKNLHDMVNSNEPLQLITTFNEWGEGSAVESAAGCSTTGNADAQHGADCHGWESSDGYGQYIDAMHAIVPMRDK